jgi:hypothetical protein
VRGKTPFRVDFSVGKINTENGSCIYKNWPLHYASPEKREFPMSAISHWTSQVPNDSAIAIAERTLNACMAKDQSMLEFERELLTSRETYDQKNKEIDNTLLYPPVNELKDTHNKWSKRLDQFTLKEKELTDLSSETENSLIQLRSVNFSSTTLANLRFLHPQAAKQIENSYNELTTKIALIDKQLTKIKQVAAKAIEEIAWIEQHPHKRLEQTIARILKGQRAPCLATQLTDKVLRNTTTLNSLLPKFAGPS